MTITAASPYAPPSSLSQAARTHWRSLVTTYAITDTAGRLLLESALTSWDRMQSAQREIKKGGLLIKGKPNPALGIERAAKMELLRAFSALRLDLEPLNAKPGRPPNQ